jgi:hypothetical protein
MLTHPWEDSASRAPKRGLVHGGGETMRVEARPHGAALAGPLARSLVLAGLGAAVAVLGSRLAWPVAAVGAFAVAAAAVAAFHAVLHWDRTRLILTRDQLVVAHGLLRRRIAAVDVEGAAIRIEQTVPGRLLGYGTIVVGDLEVPFVPDARRLAGSV